MKGDTGDLTGDPSQADVGKGGATRLVTVATVTFFPTLSWTNIITA
jgi:hypothetical protein